MRKNISLFMIVLFAIIIANKGIASNTEGVYIEDKESVVFFSKDYKIANLKSEEKIVIYKNRCEQKDVKNIKNNNSRIFYSISKKALKKEDVFIPLRHLVFYVKNAKNSNFSILHSKDTNIIFYFSSNSKYYRNIYDIITKGINCIYVIQKQIVKGLFYSVLSYLFFAKHYSFLIGSLLVIFFWIKVRENSKKEAYYLKRGPPVICFLR